MKRFPILTLTIGALAIATHIVPGSAGWLQFSRAALERGAVWRLATGHVTHFNAEHLLWDVAALLLLGTIAERQSRRACAATLGIAALVISLGVWVFQPQFATYRGLSGLDSALFGFIAGRLISDGRRTRDTFSSALAGVGIAGFTLKCAYETMAGAAVFVPSDGFAPVPLAHALGAATGLVVALVSVRERSIEQALQLRDPDRLHRAIEPELLDQRSVSKRV